MPPGPPPEADPDWPSFLAEREHVACVARWLPAPTHLANGLWRIGEHTAPTLEGLIALAAPARLDLRDAAWAAGVRRRTAAQAGCLRTGVDDPDLIACHATNATRDAEREWTATGVDAASGRTLGRHRVRTAVIAEALDLLGDETGRVDWAGPFAGYDDGELLGTCLADAAIAALLDRGATARGDPLLDAITGPVLSPDRDTPGPPPDVDGLRAPVPDEPPPGPLSAREAALAELLDPAARCVAARQDREGDDPGPPQHRLAARTVAALAPLCGTAPRGSLRIATAAAALDERMDAAHGASLDRLCDDAQGAWPILRGTPLPTGGPLRSPDWCWLVAAARFLDALGRLAPEPPRDRC